jgi:hypothetical protein
VRNPRLNDEFGGLPFSQDDVPFLIPHLREDLPVCIDPFLLWNSDNDDWHGLHQQLLGFLGEVRRYALEDQTAQAVALLLKCEEQPALGLGYAAGTKAGSSLGPALATLIAQVFPATPQLHDQTPTHLEELQLLVPKIKEDRISDIAGAVLKDALISFTEQQAQELSIPTRKTMVANIWDPEAKLWRPGKQATLPFNPLDDTPILLAPLTWLRTLPWINYGDYYSSYFSHYVLPAEKKKTQLPKEAVLAYNRSHYQDVESYVKKKEELGSQAFPEYYFSPLSVNTLKKRMEQVVEVPPGREGGADKAYEGFCFEFLQSAMFPELNYADSQVRTEGGTHIRDVIFYNDGKTEFLGEVRERYEVRQLVFELKNVKGLEGEHVNQLYRYLGGDFGKLGILVARTPPPKPVQKNIVDLHSAKGVVILALDDRDLQMIVSLKEANQPATAILKKKMIEFQRLLPT